MKSPEDTICLIRAIEIQKKNKKARKQMTLPKLKLIVRYLFLILVFK